MDGVELEFCDDALSAVADLTLVKKDRKQEVFVR